MNFRYLSIILALMTLTSMARCPKSTSCKGTPSIKTSCILFRDGSRGCPTITPSPPQDCTICEVIDTINTCCDELINILNIINNNIININPAAACANTFLRQAQFTPSYTISSPGKYTLCEAIVYVGGAGTSAITVNSDDVIIDMNGYSLTYGLAAADVNGISIVPDHQNISVINTTDRNGAIRQFTGAGIEADATAVTPVQQIALHNLTINNNTTGVYFNNTSCVAIAETTSCGNGIGFDINNTVGATIMASSADNNNSSTTYSAGIHLKNDTNVTIDNVSAQNNISSASHAEGIFVETSSGITINKSTTSFNQTTAAAATAAGIRYVSTLQSKILDSVSSSNKATPGNNSYGIELQSVVFSNIQKNKVSSNVFGISDDAAKSSNLFTKNIAFSNTTNYSVSYGASGSLLIHLTYPSGLATMINADDIENIEVRDTP